MKKFIITIISYLIFLYRGSLFAQTSWYVNYNAGNNANNGNSPASAVKTVDFLLQQNWIQPGDTVFIMGEYHNPSYDPGFTYSGNNDRNNPHIWHQENTIKLSNLHGNAGQYITFKPYDDQTVLKGDGANIFRINNCSYIQVTGFEIYGETEHIPWETAEGLITDGLQFLYLDPNTADPLHPTLNEVHFRVTVGTPVSVIEQTSYPVLGNVVRPSYTDTRGIYVSNSHHIVLKNNLVHHMPGGGIRVSKSSWVEIKGNEIHNCTRRSYSGTHALVVTKSNSKNKTSTDDSVYSIRIEKNKIHHNFNEIFSWAPTKSFINPRIDEGKGISLQRNNLSAWKKGNKRILVQNNIAYWNGYSGVHSNDGWHIDFINNTCYMNSYTNTVTYAHDTQKGNNIGISAQGGDDVRIYNNISVIDTDWGGFPISIGKLTYFSVQNNLIYGRNGTLTRDPDVSPVEKNTIEADPLFTGATHADFHLQSNSPAIGHALSQMAPPDDFEGNARDNHPDIGALEYSPLNSSSWDNKSKFIIYPNFFKKELYIRSTENSTQIHLYSLEGKNLSHHLKIIPGNNVTRIIIKSMEPGYYLLEIDNTLYPVLMR